MAGLNLSIGGGFGGVSGTPSASWGSPSSYESTVSSAAFGPGVTVAGPSTGQVLAPNDGFGLAFWLGIAAVGALVFIRYSLPN